MTYAMVALILDPLRISCIPAKLLYPQDVFVGLVVDFVNVDVVRARTLRCEAMGRKRRAATTGEEAAADAVEAAGMQGLMLRNCRNVWNWREKWGAVLEVSGKIELRGRISRTMSLNGMGKFPNAANKRLFSGDIPVDRG